MGKQRQQLHDNAAKFLAKRWSEEQSVEENESVDRSDDDEEEKGSMESMGLKGNFTQFRSNVLARHKDLALKDDTLRRMGSFYQAAPQAKNSNKTKRLQTITSFYKNIR